MFSFSTTTTTTTTATSSTSSESSLSLLTSTPTDVETSATITVTLTTTASTTTPSTTVANSSKMPPTTTTAYSLEQGQQQQHFTGTTSTSEQTANDPYETYTNNFDLSLLPQDYNNNNNTNNSCTEINDTNSNNINQTNLIDNIPTTVYNFNVTTSETQKQQQQPELLQEKSNCLAVPDIKIEQTWSSCPSLNTIKQEQIYQSYFPLKTEQNQLVPPPPHTYPIHFYPSPQSSPAQSEYNFPQTQFNSLKLSSTTCYESLSSSRNSLYNAASSPCPSLDVNAIKQEQLHILPPSPPESNCDTPTPQSNYSRCSSGFDFKSEPFDSDVETLSDLNKTNQSGAPTFTDTSADHQLLREYLEDTSFLKRNNLKPLALESFIGGLEEVRDNIEPVISLALEHAKREADATCAKLQISQDPTAWSANQVHAWLRSTLQQFKLPIVDDIEEKFNETGAELLQLTEDEFIKRIPECGSTLHAQLEIWKVAYSPEYSKTCNLSQNYATNNMWSSNGLYTYNNSMEEDTKDEDDFLNSNTAQSNNNIINSQEAPHQTTISNFVNNNEMLNRNSNGINNNHTASEGNNLVLPVKRTGTRNGGSHIHLWQFLKELLAAPHINGTAIRWIDRSKGIFKIEDSVRVAKLWGKRKNRPAMNYDKLSRSIRQYYKKGIMKKTERSQRLVYQFCQPYHM